MNHSRRIYRPPSGLHRRAALLAAAAAAPAVLWPDPPLPLGWNKHMLLPAGPQPVRFPPGWNKHPPLPAHAHPLATGGTPGWQLTLMAVTVILLVATLVAIANPGPGRTVASKRTHRRSDDRNRPNAETQRQPQSERPRPASRPGRDGFAGRFIQDIAAAASAAAGQHWPAPSPTMSRRRLMIAPWLRPHTVQLCIHCTQNPAGFWVSHASDQTVRWPWCLACCQWLDQSRYHIVPFDGREGAGRFQ